MTNFRHFAVWAAVGAVASVAQAAPLAPDALEIPSKPQANYRMVGERPTGGASSAIDFCDRDAFITPDKDFAPYGAKAKRQRAAASASAAARALATDVNLMGQLIYDEGKEYDPDNNDWLGFYSLPHSTGASWSLAGYTNGPINRGGYADFDDKVYRGVYLQNFGQTVAYKFLVTFDLNTFQTISAVEMSNDSFELAAFAVAKNPVDNKVYGCYISPDGSGIYWGTGDYQAGTTTKIADMSIDDRLMGLCFSPDGKAYGLCETSYGSKKLMLGEVDLATGELDFLGYSNLPFQYAFGCTWNEKNSTIVATYNTDAGSGLMELNPENGKAILLADFEADRQVVNLFVKPDTKNKVPAAPQLSVTAPEGSMTAHYTITLPTELKDGTPLTGRVDWAVTLAGQTINEGSNMVGSSIEGDAVVNETGYAEFLAYASNAEGRSDNAKVRIFIGKGMAATPQNVVLAWDEEASTMSATWDAVTASADGGYLNPAEVTYTVTDLEGNVLAENIAATSFSLQMEAPQGRTEFAWSVVANYDGRSSAAGKSNSIFLGSMTAPYAYEFTKRADFFADGFTVIDANNDGITWDLNGLGARCGHSDQNIQQDDWLITPGIFLQANKSYVFRVFAHTYTGQGERMEVKYGTSPTVAGMTKSLISYKTFYTKKEEPTELTEVITPTADGIYYIGLHAASTSNKGTTTYHIMVPRLSLSAPVDPNCPVAPTNVALERAADGSLTAGVKYTAPSKTMGGTNYTAGPTGPTMLTMNLYVGDDEEPSQTMKVAYGYTGYFPQGVTFDERGEKTVRVEAVGPAGDKSMQTSATAYVGPYRPKQPTGVSITEVYQPGTVKMSWDPVTLDTSGNPLPAGHTSYMLWKYNDEGELVKMFDEPIQQTFWTFDALEDVKEQKFVQYAVSALNWDYESEYRTYSNYMPIGVPYTLPVKYTSMADLNDKACAIGTQGYGQFGVFKAGEIPSVDDDGEFYGCRGQYTNDAAILRTGIISLIGATNPEVVLYTYKIVEGDRNIVQVAVYCNGYREVIRFDRHDDMPDGQWTKCRFDLSKWRNKNVQIEVTMGVLSISDCYVDAISIQDTPDYDLAITQLNGPTSVKAGEKFDISAMVQNIGMKECGDFEVVLFRNGQEVETRSLTGIGVDEEVYVEFNDELTMFEDGDKAVFTVEVRLPEDQNTANNASSETIVNRKISNLAGVESLEGSATEEGNLITWIAADGAVDGEITESFEKGNPWSDYFGDWTFIDGDAKPLGAINELDIPCIEHGVTTGAWWIFDMTDFTDSEVSNLNAHSGDKFIFSMYRRDNRQVNDWAISPLLNGQEQTISLWAKSLSVNYPDELEVWYTFADSFAADDYERVDGFGTKRMSAEWTEYTAFIPEGAKHFAIRARAANGMMLMVDDVTFSPAMPSLLGYNIYRNGLKLNSELLTEPSYLDTTAGTDHHTYHVTALYAEGESELSAPLHLQYSGLTLVGADNFTVGVDGKVITVANAGIAPVAVASVDGRVLATGLGSVRFVAPASGVYLVTVGNSTTKVVVK